MKFTLGSIDILGVSTVVVGNIFCITARDNIEGLLCPLDDLFVFIVGTGGFDFLLAIVGEDTGELVAGEEGVLSIGEFAFEVS